MRQTALDMDWAALRKLREHSIAESKLLFETLLARTAQPLEH
jgi:hypothetical protein